MNPLCEAEQRYDRRREQAMIDGVEPAILRPALCLVILAPSEVRFHAGMKVFHLSRNNCA